MLRDLFERTHVDEAAPAAASTSRRADLHQWFTPAWAAEAIIEQEFSWLTSGHRVIEPACGDGAFLCAVPREVEALGVEVDPVLARSAAFASGRQVIAGDFLQISAAELGFADAVIGNPPFESDLIAAFLRRSAALLREGGEVGFILPAYVLQTSSKVEKLAEEFSLSQQLLPRNLFPRLKLPLCFAKFVKDKRRRLHGFLLYREAAEIARLQRCWRETLSATRDRRGAWYSVVRGCLAALGGEADLAMIYRAIEGKRPSANPAWKEKVRQVLQHPKRFERTGPGRYRVCGDVAPTAAMQMS